MYICWNLVLLSSILKVQKINKGTIVKINKSIKTLTYITSFLKILKYLDAICLKMCSIIQTYIKYSLIIIIDIEIPF